MRLAAFLTLATCCLASLTAEAQRLPYTSQLKTDPGVGNVQGIQRFGRPLRTDPDQGDGFSFHVFPVTHGADASGFAANNVVPIVVAPNTLMSGGGPPGSQQPVVGGPAPAANANENPAANPQANQLPEESGGDPLGIDFPDPPAREKKPKEEDKPKDKTESDQDKNAAKTSQQQAPRATYAPVAASPYPAAFDWTSGLRNMGPPAVPIPISDSQTEMQSGTITRSGLATNIQQIYHQPLIQIKMRVVEVNRGDALTVGSILEYVSRGSGDTSLTSGQTANGGDENFRNISRFVGSNLASNAATGTGALINLTSQHINSLVQGLSTELNADVITAPEVVTLNGQNVEFVSGNKLPFQLGQNVIQGTNNNIQQVFYKHVGTMVSVTPRIVNWGFHGEGQGERSIQASDILDWKKLIDEMMNVERDGNYEFSFESEQEVVDGLDTDKVQPAIVKVFAEHGIELGRYKVVANRSAPAEWRLQNGNEFFLLIDRAGRIDTYREHRFVRHDGVAISGLLSNYKGQSYIPFSVQTEILFALNNFSRSDMQRVLTLIESGAISEECCRRCQSWKPQDCTIDLAVVVRLSEAGLATANDPDNATLSGSENNIRAVANVIQVRSGHGVVMAGLIGERETNRESKLPVLGDLPLVGTLFRSKAVAREKTEVLVFIEANVLDSKPTVARAQAAADFRLGQAYVDRGVLDNPLELGMHRVGFGTYLPPGSQNEQLYWEKYQRAIRKASTHLGDTLNP